ncbi:hypothetical protein OG735_06150 [Streptomyces sp. NBC_01210]|uniref:hypothetical protein n=1 Tax=Streptomyces sp. NBC_01210 TaxID=2903774 RepID=UPI002E11C92B|nr:hypothetical protein OG735_06150 [Streptomyces sp. NBC_01210]
MTLQSDAARADLAYAGFHRGLGETARASGALRAVEELYCAVPDATLISGPTGHAVVPVAQLPEAPPPLAPLEGCGLAFVRADPVRASQNPDDQRALVAALAWLRLGLSRRLLDACFGHLGKRTAHDEPLMHQQLIKGALADVATAQMEAETVLLAAGLDTAMLGDLHHQITGADRMLLRLLGAFGFTVDGPGREALLSELIADAYICYSHAETGATS